MKRVRIEFDVTDSIAARFADTGNNYITIEILDARPVRSKYGWIGYLKIEAVDIEDYLRYKYVPKIEVE